MVSPLPFQKGAAGIAASSKIKHVTLTPDSNTERYLAEFMERTFFGASIVEKAEATDTVSAVIGWATE